MLRRLFQTCLIITIGMCLIISSFSGHVSYAATDEVKWSLLSLPADGESGKWQLASGADPRCLTMTADGTLYCYATPASTTDTLFRSTDGGLSWYSIGRVKDTIIDIAVVPQDATTLYYATVSSVYRSTNGGNNFVALPPNPGGAGIGNVEITSIAVVRQSDGNLLAVSTRDTIGGQYGGVYLFNKSSPSDGWLNTNIGSYDVYNVAFSPNYTSDKALIAIVSNETDTIIRSKLANNGWGQIIGDAYLSGLTPVSATIAFPTDYQVTSGFFFALNTGVNRGDVYRFTPAFAPFPSTVTPLGIENDGLSRGIDISSLAIAGNMANTTLIAGCARQSGIYVSRDGGVHWTQSQKPPAGQSETNVVMAPDFAGQQKVYAVTCGMESAFSVSPDGGLTWHQVSLIDSKITSLVDFTFIPAEPEAALFLITHNGTNLKFSLWRSQDGGHHWQRIFTSNPPTIDAFTLVRGTDDGGLFLAGQSYGIPVIWSSTNRGQTFLMRPAPCAIDTWTFLDANTFFIGGYNGSTSLVYSTGNGGISYSQPVEIGARSLTSIRLSPDYLNDRTILAGNTGGQVFLSTDNGGSFRQLGQQLPVITGTGKISLAFDRNFNKNSIVYAAVDTKTTSTSKERLFRFTIGQSTAWQTMYSSLPDNAIISQIVVTDDGTFYAINGQGVVIADGKGGLLRSLSPVSQSAFEITMRGLDEAVILNGLWANNNQLWSLDTKNTVLMTINDSLTMPVILESPLNKVSGMDTDIMLDWQTLPGATDYEWQINDEASFSSLPAGFNGTTTATSTRLSDLKPAVTFYWRVRVIKPLLSPWSDTFSFTTMLGGANGAPVLSFPEVGSITTINPVFQWQTVPGADRYELMVSNNTDFFTPAVCCTGEQALFANAWHCDTNLEYETTYFWKVRACTATNSGEWSAVSAFITERAPITEGPDSITQEQTPEQQITSVSPVPQQPLPTATTIQLSVPGWAIYAGLALLIIIVVLLTALIMALFSSRRL